MKIHVDLDITPEEMRRFLGLPDVAPLQKELMEKLRERMEAGIADHDPVKLMEPFLTGNMKSFENLQNLFFGSLAKKRDSDSSA